LIDVNNTDHELMNGMSTQVFFDTEKAENVLVVPARALQKRLPDKDNEQGNAYSVIVKSGSKKQERVIHVGIMTRTLAEVRDGLNDGEKVVVPESDVGAKSSSGGRRGPPIGPRI